MDEQAWHQWRSEGVGASDVAKAMGAYGWTPQRVVEDKLNPQPPTPFLQRLFDQGHAAERGIVRKVGERYGMFVAGQQTAWEHPRAPHRRCTLDGVLVDDEWSPLASGLVVEAKWTRSANPGWDHYRVQVQYQLAVTGMAGGFIGVRRDGSTDVVTEEVTADALFGRKLLSLADDLWAVIVARREQADPTRLGL